MSDIINYENLVSFLGNASLFEMYRISVAISNELENPARIAFVRKQFKEGDLIEYFDASKNTLISAIAIKKNPKYVLARHCHNGRHINLPYYLLKCDAREFDFSSKKRGLTKNEMRVGDVIGFNKDGEEIVGRVERLNQKTVSLVTETNHRWRVAYAYLYAVIDA